jgi:hypothetical protein
MAGVLTAAGTATLQRAGWARAWRRGRGAAIATWAIVAATAFVAIAPAWAWWSRTLSHRVEATQLLGYPSVSLLVELFRDDPSAARMIVAAALAGAVVAFLLNPFLAGGMIGVLAWDGDPAERRARFAASGAAHYGPLFRAALLIWPVGALGTALLVLVVGFGVGAAGLPVAFGLGAVGLALIGGATTTAMLVDLARTHVVYGQSRRALVAVVAALRVAVGHAAALLPLAIVFTLLFAAASAALVAARGTLSLDGWGTILAAVGVQQAHTLARVWLRSALLASELVVVESAAALEQRPEVFVVVEGEAGEPRQPDDERFAGRDLPPEIPGGLSAEGDAGRGDAGPGEPGPAGGAVDGDRQRAEPPPVA